MIIVGGFSYSTYIKFQGEISSPHHGMQWSHVAKGGVRLDSVYPFQAYLVSSTGSFGLESLLYQPDHLPRLLAEAEISPQNCYNTGITVFALELGFLV